MDQARLLLGGEWVDGGSVEQACDTYTGKAVAEVHLPTLEQVGRATRALAEEQACRAIPAYERYRILARAAELLLGRRQQFVETIVTDSGFTVADAGREIERAAETLLLSAEEAKRIHGEVVPLHGAPGAAGASGRIAFTTRHPLGVVCAITPFNSPLNTVLHKVAPAIAADNAVLLKPASYTPLTAWRLVELLLEAGLPAGRIALVYGGGSTVGQWLLEDPVPSFYAFTGSTETGEHIRRTIGLRRSQLEMGSLSSTIVCEDASLERCVPLCVNAAFRKAGQVCTSVQRLYVQHGLLEEFLARLGEATGKLQAGDPHDPAIAVGPVISAADAERIGSWIAEALEGGASLVAGGSRRGQVVEPTVLAGVSDEAALMCQEVFGPVVSVSGFDELDDAIERVNATPYGLAAGIFTNDLNAALAAAGRLRMGGVHINETSSSRVDLMPYGGVKLSGLGLEGPRYAVEEMTEQRLITIGPS